MMVGVGIDDDGEGGEAFDWKFSVCEEVGGKVA